MLARFIGLEELPAPPPVPPSGVPIAPPPPPFAICPSCTQTPVSRSQYASFGHCESRVQRPTSPLPQATSTIITAPRDRFTLSSLGKRDGSPALHVSGHCNPRKPRRSSAPPSEISDC